ncbi:MAG: PAS domain S-box protein, partial [Chloroflexota bacterium]|nr:PAS domain S-box protein [Chloroflexota bacterium]
MFEKPTYEELEQRVRELEQAESESKRAEEALRKSDEHLSATLRSIGDGVISCNTDGTVASLNAVAEKLTGWTAVEAEGQPIDEVFNIVNTQTRKKAENPVKRSLKEGAVVGLANHTLLIGKDGNEYQIADSCAPIKGKDGEIMGCVLVFRDVTGEYEQREALRKSEELLKGVFNSVQDGMSVLDKDLNILKVNQTMNKWYESNTPLKGKKCYECYQNADNPCDPCPTLRCMKTGQVEREIVKGLSGSSVQWIELYSYPMWDDQNEKITGAVEFVRDITSRKQADEALLKSEERFRVLSNDLPALICEFLPDTTLTFVNHAYCEFFGMSAEKLIGCSFLDLIPEEAREDTKKQFSSLTMQKPVKTYTHEVIKNGKIAWQEWRDRAIFDEQGQILKYHSIGIDITERKEAEESLRESEKFFSGTLNNLHTFIGVLEPNGKVIFVNNTPLEAVGIELEDIAGKIFCDTYWWTHSEEVIQTLKQDIEACASGEIVFREIEIRMAHGS